MWKVILILVLSVFLNVSLVSAAEKRWRREPLPNQDPLYDVFMREVHGKTGKRSWISQRFRLYTKCARLPYKQSIDLHLGSEKRVLGRRVRDLVESRLRSARLFSKGRPKEWSPELRVLVSCRYTQNLADWRCETSVSLHKALHDRVSGETALTETAWTTEETFFSGEKRGSPERMVDSILFKLSQAMDRFLVNYLRVNDKACEKRFVKKQK